jgi:hypothetical protein
MPFTAPNRYAPREDWDHRLKMIGPAVGSWQFDLVVYWQWRDTQKRELQECWTSLGMTPDNAQKALMTADPRPTNDSGLIPPEIFSRLLARSQATSIDPKDDVSPVIIEEAIPVKM